MAPESRLIRKGRSDASRSRPSNIAAGRSSSRGDGGDDMDADLSSSPSGMITALPLRRDVYSNSGTIRAVTPDMAQDAQDIGHGASPRRAPPSIPTYESAGQSRQSRFRTGSVNDVPRASGSRASSRPRTRTLDQLGSRDVSPAGQMAQAQHRGHRQGMSSVNSTTSNASYIGIDDAVTSIGHISTVPGEPAPAKPVASRKLSSRTQQKELPAVVASRSPEPYTSRQTQPHSIPEPDIGRMVKLMQSSRGRMDGSLAFRRGDSSPWAVSHCSINDEAGSLIYETKSQDNFYRTLVPDLRGCRIHQAWDPESKMLFLDILPQNSRLNIHLRPHTRDEFESWLAALMCWHPMRPKGIGNRMAKTQEPGATNLTDRRPAHARRQSEAIKEAPVIKVGKMIHWDTSSIGRSAGPSRNGSTPLTPIASSFGIRRWQRVSCTLRENGEFKLFTEKDAQVVATVKLSHLCRYAVQRLDPSVLDNDFSIAIYPQYSAVPDQSQASEPVLISLESRVLYEVWLVLLRAFTIPQLYGPKQSSSIKEKQRIADELALSPDMFRLERTLFVKVTDARLTPPMSPTSQEKPLPSARPSQKGDEIVGDAHFVEIMFDGETRAKTTAKTDINHPFWGEEFEFPEMPPVVSVASILLKRRPPGEVRKELSSTERTKQMFDTLNTFEGGGDAQGGVVVDPSISRVDIYLDDLQPGKDLEKWWTLRNHYGQTIGEINVKVAVVEHVILMARDYQPMSEILHTFSNGLTQELAQCMSQDLKRLSEALLSIFQVSGSAYDWLLALIEEEIDSTEKEATVHSRFRISRRLGSNEDSEGTMFGPPIDRELLVRDMGKNATLEANLLFRGNTLLTKSLDLHMRRLGKEYLEETLGDQIKEISDRDLDCEVDPNKIVNANDLDRNWRNLMRATNEIWKCIGANAAKCPLEMRFIFRHIRACAEDRYGGFSRTVSYSSVSGFLFLRFFCPAILNPKLFGLVKEIPRANARRCYTLIAKSIQGLANMSNFGHKEQWMEPMNAFITNNRISMKKYIDDVCSVDANDVPQGPMPPSYSTPLQILGRLPSTSKEGFPSLPYLIDHAGSHAALVSLWVEHDKDLKITEEDGEIWTFSQMCMALHQRTQDCLANAERAERPSSLPDHRWDHFVKQLEAEKARHTETASRNGDRDRQLNLQMPPSSSKSSKHKPSTRPQSPLAGSTSAYPIAESVEDAEDADEAPSRGMNSSGSAAEHGLSSSFDAARTDRFGMSNAGSFSAAREAAKVKEKEKRAREKEEKRARLRGVGLDANNNGPLSARHRSASSSAVATLESSSSTRDYDTTNAVTSSLSAVYGRSGASAYQQSGNHNSNTASLSLIGGGRQMSEPRPSTSSTSTLGSLPPGFGTSSHHRERPSAATPRAASSERHIISAVANASSLNRMRSDPDERVQMGNVASSSTIASASPLTRLERDIASRNKLRKDAPPNLRSYSDDLTNNEKQAYSSHHREASSSSRRQKEMQPVSRDSDPLLKQSPAAALQSSSVPMADQTQTSNRKRSVQDLGIMGLNLKRAITPTPSIGTARKVSSSTANTPSRKDSSAPRSREASVSKSNSRAVSPFPSSAQAQAQSLSSSLSFFANGPFSGSRKSSRAGSRATSQPASRPGSSRGDQSRNASRPHSRFGQGYGNQGYAGGASTGMQPGSLAPSDVEESDEGGRASIARDYINVNDTSSEDEDEDEETPGARARARNTSQRQRERERQRHGTLNDSDDDDNDEEEDDGEIFGFGSTEHSSAYNNLNTTTSFSPTDTRNAPLPPLQSSGSNGNNTLGITYGGQPTTFSKLNPAPPSAKGEVGAGDKGAHLLEKMGFKRKKNSIA